MFKTLLTTALLSFSLGSGTLKQLPPKNANSYGTYYLRGSYCINNVIGNNLPEDFYDAYEYKTYTIYDYESYNNYAYDIYCSYYISSNGKTESLIVRSFDITCSMDAPDDEMYYNLHLFVGGEYTIRQEMIEGDSIESFYPEVKDLIVYFPRAYYVGEETYNAFTSLFNGVGNAYVEGYNGYFTFTTASNGNNWFVYGDVLYENSLYNFINYNLPLNETANCYVALNDYEDLYGETLSANVITNGVLNGKNYVMFNNVLISTRVKSRMTLTGVFAYVRPEQPVTFGEMIFAVIDAPIYMLSQLFSFKLFGVEFYVAFMGIVTVVLICFVVKKIV